METSSASLSSCFSAVTVVTPVLPPLLPAASLPAACPAAAASWQIVSGPAHTGHPWLMGLRGHLWRGAAGPCWGADRLQSLRSTRVPQVVGLLERARRDRRCTTCHHSEELCQPSCESSCCVGVSCKVVELCLCYTLCDESSSPRHLHTRVIIHGHVLACKMGIDMRVACLRDAF